MIIFFHYSWFTVFCQFSAVQHGDPVTHTCIHSFFSHYHAPSWKQPKCPLTEDWIQKMWYIYTMEYFLAIKKNKIMPFAATGMELETLILNEISQKEKDKYHISITGV